MTHLCKNCLHKIHEKDHGSRFPTFTFFGLLAAIPAFLINPLLVPIGIGAGVVADAVKCRLCGSTEDLFEVDVKTDRWGRPIVTRAALEQFEGRESLEDDTFDFELENQQPEKPDTQFTIDESDFTESEISFDTGDSGLDIDTSFDIGDTGLGDAGGSGGSSGGGGK